MVKVLCEGSLPCLMRKNCAEPAVAMNSAASTLKLMFVLLAMIRHHEAFGAENPRRRLQREPMEVLEVSRPPDVAREICTQVLVQHVFGNSVDEAPVVRRYVPSCNCSDGDEQRGWSRVVLRWTASCTGRQFDRISAVWLGGVEILRTCTAEPVKQPGIQWTVQKDVTRYSSLWARPQMLAFQLANVVSLADSLTGLYNVTLSVHFYAETEAHPTTTKKFTKHGAETDAHPRAKFKNHGAEVVRPFKSSATTAADVILPFPSPSPDHWIRIRDEDDVQARRMRDIPRTAYRAVLEICVSFHGRDEFWYANKPNEYFAVNNFTDEFENGPFREILVAIDDDVLPAGVVHPFPVIYTGGVNPFFWRPVTAIGSFVLPSYDVDVTPFLARLVDGDAHTFRVSVTNALSFWLLGLNLHIWVDSNSPGSTRGKMVRHSSSISTLLENLDFLALDGTFLLKTSRMLSHSGWLVSSFGNLTTGVEFSAEFSHSLTVSDSANAFRVLQDSVTERTVVVKSDERSLLYHHELYRFPLRLSMHQFPNAEGSVLQIASIDHAWEEERQYECRGRVGYGGPSFFSTLKNRQQSRGSLVVPPVGETRGVATMHQSLFYDGSGGCYSRTLGVEINGSYLFDHSHTRCT